jgi:ATPase subunit of ABC transporter with duplicated ATPase domains
VITATGLELRAGARILLEPTTLRVGPGDRIGLVGRNGAGKTTSLRVLAGETQPHAGSVERKGPVGYLPQDPRTGDLDVIARDRVLSARGLDQLVHDIAKVQIQLAETPDDAALVGRYGVLEDRFSALGGYAAESDAARICANLGLPDRVLLQPLGTLSGGQRRRVELARILFADSGGEPTTLLLDEPTNHLDADSITWLRDFLRRHDGGLIVISHDVSLLEAVVNRVWYLDANRTVIDAYNMGWKTYLQQRETDERRRHRERANAERKIESLKAQADKMRAKATKARAAHQMDRRASALAAGLDEVRVGDRVARLRFPAPAASGRTPLTAEGLSKSYGSLEVFADVDLAVDRGARVVVLGLNGAGKTTLLRILAGIEPPDTGSVVPGHGLRLGYYAQEHETLDHDRSVLENMRSAASATGRSDLTDTDLRKVLGAFLFSGDDVDKPAGVL